MASGFFTEKTSPSFPFRCLFHLAKLAEAIVFLINIGKGFAQRHRDTENHRE